MRVKSIKNADVLIKFVDEEYIDSTIKNGFFFNRLEAFKNSDGLTDEQLDSDEGSLVDYNMPIKIEIMDAKFKKKPIEIPINSVKNFKRRINYSFVSKIPICCFTILKFPYDFSFVKINENVYEYKIKDEIIERLSGISNGRRYVYCLEQDMIKQLNKEILNGRSIKAKKVQYYKEEGRNISHEEIKKDPIRVIFMKNIKYKNQKEFRIAMLDRKESGFLKLSELNLQTSKDANLNNFRMYINKKYDDNLIEIQIADYSDKIFCANKKNNK